MLDARPESERMLRRMTLRNLSRMGHCAPTVMQTLLDADETEAEWLVKLTAGLPGGIGNTGGECGGVTAPLILLGLRHGGEDRRGLPLVLFKGHDLLRRFVAYHGTTSCREIRGEDHLPLRCIRVIRQAPPQCARTLSEECTDALTDEETRAYRCFYAHVSGYEFHCAHSVFRQMKRTIRDSAELQNATSAFIGGTLFTGATCSAFTAGVMALGLTLGKLEHSRLRVARMIARMAIGRDALADDLNAFNRIMNLGHRLSEWFSAEFGTNQCRTITDCDLSTMNGAQAYIQSAVIKRCLLIAESVARKVEEVIQLERGERT